jgi:mRNA interferase MazF
MVIKKKISYVPDRGDIVWLDFDPVRGHEQQGYRPAYVVSPSSYNEKRQMALVCPITSKIKGFSFEVSLSGEVKGVILVDHVRAIDWVDRKVKYVEKIEESVVQEVTTKLLVLIGG